MSLALETVHTSPSSSISDPSDTFVMVPNSSSLQSSDVEVLNESLDQKQINDPPGSLPSRSVSDDTRDNGLIGKLFALSKENEELRETLKHNNQTLQKHINEFAEVQESYKRNNEAVKKEHQKAKEVVTKLRNENKSLKEQLKLLQLQHGEISKKEREVGLERENTFLKQQISTLQEQIAHIDREIKDSQFTETAAIESWQQLLGSIASYEFQTGTLSSGIEQGFIKREASGEDNRSLEDRYAKLETEKEILNVDLDKMKVEKNHVEEQLLQLLEEQKKLKTSCECISEEKEELQRMLNERFEKDAECKNEMEKLEEVTGNLKAQVNTLNEELNKANEKCAKSEEEKEKSAKEYEMKIKKLDEELRERQREQVEMELNAKKGNEQEDEDDTVSRIKFESVKNQYLKYERQVFEMEEKNGKLQEQLKSLEKERSALHDELKNLQKDKETAEEKLLETRALMEKELETRSETYREKLRQLHSELEEGRNREENHQGQMENLQSEFQEELERLQSEIEAGEAREKILQQKLEDLQSVLQGRGSTEESLQEQVCHLMKENNSMSIKLTKMTELNARRDALYEERMKEMEREANKKQRDTSSIVDMLKAQLGSSKEETKKYLEQCQFTKMEHDRLVTQHETLMKEYNDLLNMYNGTVEDNRNKHHGATAELENYKRQLDYTASEVLNLEEAVHKKDHQLNKMMDELQELQTYKDNVPVLKQQLEVYCNDFRAEREARERQHAELLQQQEENERLRLVNEDLQRDLDNIAHNQMAEMQRRHGSHVPSHSVVGSINPQSFRNGFFRRGGDPDPREGGYEGGGQGPHAEQPEEPYPCHGCRQNFARFSDLQTHVRECPEALHGNGPPQPGLGNSQPSCPKCGNEFPDIDTLQIHVLECLDS